MSHDKDLEERILKMLDEISNIEVKKMFGGVVFMHRGNMLCGIDKTRLMVRVGPEQHEKVLKLKHAKVMDITGKSMKGFIFVYPPGTKTQGALKKWLKLGLKFTNTLKAKK